MQYHLYAPFVIMGSFSHLFQVVYGDVYMLDDEMKWKELPPMPKPDSHIESSWVIVNNSIIITGGTTEKHPVTKRMMLTGEVFRFRLDTLVIMFSYHCLPLFYFFWHSNYVTNLDVHLFFQLQTWSVIGKLPFRVKTTLTGFWDGWLYFTSGQRDRGPDNPQPKKVIGELWRTKLHL